MPKKEPKWVTALDHAIDDVRSDEHSAPCAHAGQSFLTRFRHDDSKFFPACVGASPTLEVAAAYVMMTDAAQSMDDEGKRAVRKREVRGPLLTLKEVGPMVDINANARWSLRRCLTNVALTCTLDANVRRRIMQVVAEADVVIMEGMRRALVGDPVSVAPAQMIESDAALSKLAEGVDWVTLEPSCLWQGRPPRSGAHTWDDYSRHATELGDTASRPLHEEHNDPETPWEVKWTLYRRECKRLNVAPVRVSRRMLETIVRERVDKIKDPTIEALGVLVRRMSPEFCEATPAWLSQTERLNATRLVVATVWIRHNPDWSRLTELPLQEMQTAMERCRAVLDAR